MEKNEKDIERDLNVLHLDGSPGELWSSWREGSSSSCRFPRPKVSLVCDGVDNPSIFEHYFYYCYKLKKFNYPHNHLKWRTLFSPQ